MAFALDNSYVVFDGNDFATQKDTINNRHYHEDRIEIKGMLSFGLISRRTEAKIDLQANGINAPLIIDSIQSYTTDGGSDELYLYFYTKDVEKGLTKVSTQRFSNAEVPVEFPDGIVFPNMVIGVMPATSNSTVTIYVKPVKVLFNAETIIQPEPIG